MKKIISALVGTALVAALTTALTPAGASAAPAPVAAAAAAATGTTTTACADATTAHRAAVTARAKATKKSKKAAKKAKKAAKRVKALVKAKKKGKKVRPAAIKKAKKKAIRAKKAKKKATRALKRAKNTLGVAAKRKATACKKPQVNVDHQQSNALAGLLGLLLGGFGGGAGMGDLTPAQLVQIFNTLAPGAGSGMDPAQLAEILAVLKDMQSGDVDPAALAQQFQDLFGEHLDPAVLAGLLSSFASGSPFDVTLIEGVVRSLVAALGDVVPGAGEYGDLTGAGLLGLVGSLVNIVSDDVLGRLGLGVVGDLLQALLNGAAPGTPGGPALSSAQLIALQATVASLVASNPMDGKLDQLKQAGVLAAVVGAMSNGAAGHLPTLADIPVLGPVLESLVTDVLRPVLCGLIPLLPSCQ